jgi:hypothetical protein
MLIVGYIIGFCIGVSVIGTLAIYFTIKPWRFLPWKF